MAQPIEKEKKPLVAVVAGGYSGERNVSLKSAANIMRTIDSTRFTPQLVLIEKERWQVVIDETSYTIDKNDFSYSLNGTKHCFDYAFITIHGTPGENGLLQGYFDMLGIPYNTSGVLTEALTFDKYTCNRYLSTFGIRIAPSIRLNRRSDVNPESIIQTLSLPCFVKPNVGGSSIATTKVTQPEQLAPAIENAFQEAPEVMVERLIEGTEVTCGCYIIGGTPRPLAVTEVVVMEGEFFDFDAKYKGKSDEITPARIGAEQTERIQRLTMEIAQHLQAEGIIRVDYIIEKDGIPTLLEVNTTPGMTDASFIPQQVAYAQMQLSDLFTQIINDKLN